jgi:hypothetical protein
MYRYALPRYGMMYMTCTGYAVPQYSMYVQVRPAPVRHDIYEMYRYAVRPRYTMIYLKCTDTPCPGTLLW